MMRLAIKAVGSSGQGINSIGEVLLKALKRTGYPVFGYREYPSLIRGGHASYQIDVGDHELSSSTTSVDILICLDHHGLTIDLPDVRPGGLIVHSVSDWQFPPEGTELINDRKLRVQLLPTADILSKLDAPLVLANVLLSSFIWEVLGQDTEMLKDLVREQYSHKGEALIKKNFACIEAGAAFVEEFVGRGIVELPSSSMDQKDSLLLNGSVGMGLGAVRAGLRVYAGYPMTPSSPLLTYIANIQKETGIIVKQAEDEITAAQFAAGAMFMGTRAMTATSGGGFDLMTETIGMCAMTETPFVVVLAQRPGPATGNPTWTSQGDLYLATKGVHGEFPRCVIAVSGPEDAYHLMPEAFNIAERYQIPVIVLTDKHVAEGIWCVNKLETTPPSVERGKLVRPDAELAELQAPFRYSTDRANGVSPRWLPGAKAATYASQSDEHSPDGSVDESAAAAKLQMEKRMRKMDALGSDLPEPELFFNDRTRRAVQDVDRSIDLLLVGWGSTKGAVLDALDERGAGPVKNGTPDTGRGSVVAYLHYSYLWPISTDKLEGLMRRASLSVLVEGNYQGQLGQLIKEQCGLSFSDRLLKYNGRPFFLEDIVNMIDENLRQLSSETTLELGDDH